MIIRRALPVDAPVLARLATLMWDHAPAELEPEFTALIISPEAACFLAYDGDTAMGFAQCQIRHDYVEGTDTSPVGYLEGIYVEAAYRSQGVARQLLHACEDWARSVGCTEFASDCELDNRDSLAFHLAVGFEEANRVICFTKKL